MKSHLNGQEKKKTSIHGPSSVRLSVFVPQKRERALDIIVLVIVADDFDYRIKWMEVQGSREGRGKGDYGIRCTATLKLCTPSPSRSLPRLEAPAKSLGRSVPGGPPSRPQGFR